MRNLIKRVVRRSFSTVGLEIRRKDNRDSVELIDGNLVVPNIWVMPAYRDLIASRIATSSPHVVLLGDQQQIDFLKPGIEDRGLKVTASVWDLEFRWNDGPDW